MQKNRRSFNLKENVTFSPSPGLSEFASIKGGINHIKSLDTDPKWKCFKYCSAAGDKNEVILTYETPLPVYQDPLQAFTLHILQIDLNLAEHEVVRLGIPVADCQQLLQAGRVQLLWILGYMWLNFPGPKLPWKFQKGSLQFWPKNLENWQWMLCRVMLVVLCSTCVACQTWVTDLQVL